MKKILLGTLILVSVFAVSERKDPYADVSERIDMLFLNCIFAADEDEYYKNAEELDILQISTTEEILSKYKAKVLLASAEDLPTFANDFCIKSYVRRGAFSEMSLDATVDNAFYAAFSDNFGRSVGKNGEGDRSGSGVTVTSDTGEVLARILGDCKPRATAAGSGDGAWFFSSECAACTDCDGGLVSIIACFDGWDFDECIRNMMSRVTGRSADCLEGPVVTGQEGDYPAVCFSASMLSFDRLSFQVTVLPGGLVLLECPVKK